MGSKMTMMKIYRNADGTLINIGEWDYMIEEYTEAQPLPFGWTPESGISLPPEYTPVKKIKINNPLPEGAYEDQAEVVAGSDGGLYLASDPRANQVG
jgi:hypothetical protein